MRIAVPILTGRVAPVFDVAQCLLVVDLRGTQEKSRREVALQAIQLGPRMAEVMQQGVSVLICGAISYPLELMLQETGIRVISRRCGPVSEIIRAFAAGRLTDGSFLMPGCGPRRRCRGGRKAQESLPAAEESVPKGLTCRMGRSASSGKCKRAPSPGRAKK